MACRLRRISGRLPWRPLAAQHGAGKLLPQGAPAPLAARHRSKATKVHVDASRVDASEGSAQDLEKLPGSYDGAPWKRSSILTPSLPEGDAISIDELIQDDIAHLASMKPRPVNMQEIIEMLKPKRIARYLHSEVPIRFAERIRWIEQVPVWTEVPELVTMHDLHVESFRKLRLVKRRPNLEAFTKVVQDIQDAHHDSHHVLARGIHRLHLEHGSAYGPAFADEWLDKFLLNNIGTGMLLSQYLACVNLESCSEGAPRSVFAAGIVDPDCDIAKICHDARDTVMQICEEITGKAPLVRVEVHSEKGAPKFSYVPGFLKFILVEILKNSCRATAENCKSPMELRKRPIDVIICGDEHRVAIRVADKARGIPFDIDKQVWSYLYTTGAKNLEGATALAGFGVGLPLSRLYARYLGGSLDLVSLPGYGTSVDLFLLRLQSEQVELVPDDDNE